ncbi:hypothetical protein [Pradoshia sp.]
MDVQSILVRKMTAAFFMTMMTSMILAYWYVSAATSGEPPYQLGESFLGWTFLYALYVGAVVLIYGNLVSGAIEYGLKKGLIQHTWLYVLCHGLLGLIFGCLFKEPLLAITGMAVAIFYALLDRWLFARANDAVSIKLLLLSPVLACGLLWGYFQIQSEPMPPFTEKEAIEFATNGEGSVSDVFPVKAGKWKGIIDGYDVERETSAKEIGYETYIVLFKETWDNGKENGSWYMSYEVDRNGMSAKAWEGTYPPYAN